MGELIDETETESIEVRKKRILNASTTAYTCMRTYSISCVALHIHYTVHIHRLVKICAMH